MIGAHKWADYDLQVVTAAFGGHRTCLLRGMTQLEFFEQYYQRWDTYPMILGMTIIDPDVADMIEDDYSQTECLFRGY